MQTYEVHGEIRQSQPTAVVTATLPVAAIGPWLAKSYGAIASALAAHGSVPAGPPFARYHQLGDGMFSVEAGFPVVTAVDAADGISPSALPGGPVAVTTHIGPYEEMPPAYEALAAWVGDHGGAPAGDPWEVYLGDPSVQPDPAAWRTDVVQPYAAG